MMLVAMIFSILMMVFTFVEYFIFMPDIGKRVLNYKLGEHWFVFAVKYTIYGIIMIMTAILVANLSSIDS